MIRESAQTTGLLKKYGMRDVIAHAMFTEPDKIHLLRDGKGITTEDNYEERALHVMTRQGPRDALKRSFYIEKPTVKFVIKVTKPIFTPKPKEKPEDKDKPKKTDKKEKSPEAIDKDTLETLFVVGQNIGLGADRSQGEGKFELRRFERIVSH